MDGGGVVGESRREVRGGARRKFCFHWSPCRLINLFTLSFIPDFLLIFDLLISRLSLAFIRLLSPSPYYHRARHSIGRDKEPAAQGHLPRESNIRRRHSASRADMRRICTYVGAVHCMGAQTRLAWILGAR